jgi:hypothetical protein
MNHTYQCPTTGKAYGRGLLPKKLKDAFPVYGPAAGFPQYMPDQVAQIIANGGGDLSAGLRQVLDQGSYGLCWDFSATQALMVDRVLKGQQHVLLDVSVGPVLTGNGLNTGGAIEDMLLQVQLVTGQPPAAIIPGSDPTQARVNLDTATWPADWRTRAAGFRVVRGKWLECDSILALASAVCDGHPGVMGVDWQGGGHALCVLSVESARGELYLCGPNSWGESWQSGWGTYGPARPGWYRLSERQCAEVNTYGAYALCGETYADVDGVP